MRDRVVVVGMKATTIPHAARGGTPGAESVFDLELVVGS